MSLFSNNSNIDTVCPLFSDYLCHLCTCVYECLRAIVKSSANRKSHDLTKFKCFIKHWYTLSVTKKKNRMEGSKPEFRHFREKHKTISTSIIRISKSGHRHGRCIPTPSRELSLWITFLFQYFNWLAWFRPPSLSVLVSCF